MEEASFPAGEIIIFLLTSTLALPRRNFHFLSTHLPNWTFRLGCSLGKCLGVTIAFRSLFSSSHCLSPTLQQARGVVPFESLLCPLTSDPVSGDQVETSAVQLPLSPPAARSNSQRLARPPTGCQHSPVPPGRAAAVSTGSFLAEVSSQCLDLVLTVGP